MPDSQTIDLARDLIERSRDVPACCEDVRQLVRHLGERGAAAPAWQADLQDRCDILHVPCAGTQPELAARIIGPNGIRHTDHCTVDGSIATGPSCNIRHGDSLDLAIDADTALACGEIEYTYRTEGAMLVEFSQDQGELRITNIHLSPDLD